MLTHRLKIIAVAVMGVVLVTACEGLPGTKTEQGTIAGGAAGAVIGERVGGGATGALIGAIAGGVLGHSIGRRLEERDRQMAARSLEENHPLTWTNEQTDTAYRMTPQETYERNGRTCREYSFNAKVEGQWQDVHGVACRNPDGTWQSVS